MGDKGKRDKGKREQQKKAQLNPKEKRKLKKEKRVDKCPALSGDFKASLVRPTPGGGDRDWC